MKNFKLVLIALATIVFASQTLAGIAKQKPPQGTKNSTTQQKPPILTKLSTTQQKPPQK
jgi:hypothetical protein